jgi:adenine phosphoribosyltransferase
MNLPTSLKDLIRTIPDYPKKGIMFRDITTLMQDPAGFRRTVDELVYPFAGSAITRVAGIEARGFILGGAVAHQLSIGFVAVRKKGKLPWQTISVEYELEYGTDEVEIHIDSIDQGDQILIIDDLIATGGTAAATTQLVRDAGGEVVGASFIVDLPDLGGRARLEAMGVPVRTLVSFEGE